MQRSSSSDFEFLGKLGKGSFGVVYKVRRKVDKKVYVLKQINISQMDSRIQNTAINEVKILSSLGSPYIVKYFDSFLEKNVLNIVMEYCEGGDLSNYIRAQMGRPLQENKIWKFFLQMCAGLDFIHKKKILHRDIKSMNIFLSKEEDVRIGDLGVAKALAESANFANTMVGTPYYLSPEMCEEKPYNEKSDIWALGCVLYEMCTQKHPFEANNQAALVLKIIRGKYNPVPNTYSGDLIELVDLCLAKDVRKRPTAANILSKTSVVNRMKALNIILENPQKPIEAKKDKEDQAKSEAGSDKPKSQDPQKREKTPPPNAKREDVKRVLKPEPKKADNNLLKVQPSQKALVPKEKSPIGGKPAVAQKELHDKNVVRIRKGAPQQLGRQAVNAGNQKLVKPGVGEPAQIKRPVLLSDKEKPPEVRPLKPQPRPEDVDDVKNLPEKLFGIKQFNFEHKSLEEQVREAKQALFKGAANRARNQQKTPEPSSSDENANNNSKEDESFNDRSVDQKEKSSHPPDLILPEDLKKNESVEISHAVVELHDGIYPSTLYKHSAPIDPTQVKWSVSEAASKSKDKISYGSIIRPSKTEEHIPVVYVKDEEPEFRITDANFHMEANEEEETKDDENDDSDGAYDENSQNGDDDDEDQPYEEDEEEAKHEQEDPEENSNEEQDEGQQENNEEEHESDEDKDGEDTVDKITADNDAEKKEQTLKKLEAAQKKRDQIDQLIKIRSAECIRGLGQKSFDEVITFFRKKLRADEDLDDKAQAEIDKIVREKLGNNLATQNAVYTIYRILRLEIELEKCDEQIKKYNFELV